MLNIVRKSKNVKETIRLFLGFKYDIINIKVRHKWLE